VSPEADEDDGHEPGDADQVERKRKRAQVRRRMAGEGQASPGPRDEEAGRLLETGHDLLVRYDEMSTGRSASLTGGAAERSSMPRLYRSREWASSVWC
jgi:hypothetical protein